MTAGWMAQSCGPEPRIPDRRIQIEIPSFAKWVVRRVSLKPNGSKSGWREMAMPVEKIVRLEDLIFRTIGSYGLLGFRIMAL